MSDDQPQVLESKPSALTSDPQLEDAEDEDHGTLGRPLLADQVRTVIRLIQCRKCSFPLRDPVTLPCGRSLCRHCLPDPHEREFISYPADPSRRQGFTCPFLECSKEHALGDAGTDVVLTKVISHFRTEMVRATSQAHEDSPRTTRVMVTDPRSATGIPMLAGAEYKSADFAGPKLAAAYSMADMGDLAYDADLLFDDASSDDVVHESDQGLFMQVKKNTRTEMDCQVCYALFYDPLTTACGHTFCRSCLHRVLDHSIYCPICRRGLSVSPLLHSQACPSNEYISKIIHTFWADALLARGDALAAEAHNRHREFDIPIFVCTLAFPKMPTFLHVFEPRYRLMIRRALEGDRTFGMCMPQRPRNPNDAFLAEYGTLLRIVNVEYFADGRSLIETQGISRFKVLRSGILDGYVVGKIERIDDISIAEEEEIEATETQQQPVGTTSISSRRGDSQSNQVPILTKEDIGYQPTDDLLQFAIDFVNRRSRQSVPWLAQRMLTIYGECPNDAARFPWWFASILPAKEAEKYRLLETRSVRERLKICCGWVLEWETRACLYVQ